LQQPIVVAGSPYNLISLFRQILSQPEHDVFRGGHHRPRWTRGLDQDSQRVRSRSKDLIHGSIERSLEGAIRLGRNKMGVCSEHAAEIADFKIPAKDVDRVCAVEAKRGLL
jgi:hypothetical protein